MTKRNARLALRAILMVIAWLTLAEGGAQAGTATTLALTSSCPTSGAGIQVTFLASVKAGGVPVTTGTVTFLKDGVSIGSVSVVDGKTYSATRADLPLGSGTITANYAANATYAASSGAPLPQTVLAPSSTTIGNSMMSITIGANAAITSRTCVPNGSQLFASFFPPVGLCCLKTPPEFSLQRLTAGFRHNA